MDQRHKANKNYTEPWSLRRDASSYREGDIDDVYLLNTVSYKYSRTFSASLLILLISGVNKKRGCCKNSSISEWSPLKRSSQVLDRRVKWQSIHSRWLYRLHTKQILVGQSVIVLKHYFLIGNSLNVENFHIFIQ